MSSIYREAAEELRRKADELEKAGEQTVIPKSTVPIQQAIDDMRRRFPKGYWSISFTVSSSGNGSRVKADWRVYDGDKHHCSPDLAAALKLAFDTQDAKNRPEVGEEQLDAMLESVLQ